MKSITPTVSVIVPIYNTDLYLENCLNSIIKQTYRSIEIILVNDGSTDRSQEIIDSFAHKDERIVTLSQTNQGVSVARNAGLRIAKGEYILFVDSDDTIRHDAVEELCRQAVETGADIVIGNVFFCYPDGKQIPLFGRISEFSKQPPQTGVQCFMQFIESFIFPPLVYLYFTKRDLIQTNRFFFEEGIVHEDELWCIKALVYAPRASILDFFHYFYHEREGSIMHSDNREYRVSSFFRVVCELEKFAATLQERQEFAEAIGFIYVRIFYIYHSMCKLFQEMKEETNAHKEYFEQLLKNIYPVLSPFQQQACSNYFRNGNRPLFSHTPGLSLSFCITCKNRVHQIKQTLPENLENNREHKDFVEFILVDFGSTDGLQEWIIENFMNEIEEGYLKYYYTEELPFWHMSIAKNTSHVLANNDILVNLDCDNFVGKNGGLFVIDRMVKYGWNNTVLHQFGNEYNDGSHGRIALSKTNFLMLGGYDESFEPAGYQDNDLLLRAQLLGLNYIHIPDSRYSRAIINSHEDGIANTISNLTWKEMDECNRQMSLKNITSGKLIANTEKNYIGIIENIYTFQDG